MRRIIRKKKSAINDDLFVPGSILKVSWFFMVEPTLQLRFQNIPILLTSKRSKFLLVGKKEGLGFAQPFFSFLFFLVL